MIQVLVEINGKLQSFLKCGEVNLFESFIIL